MRQTRHGSCPALDDEGLGDFRSMAAMRADALRGSKRLRCAIHRLQNPPPKRVRKINRVRKNYGTWAERKGRLAEIERLQCIVADHFGMPAENMTARRGTFETSERRQVAMYLARSVVRASLPDIGKAFGGRDHTTVLHGVRRIEQRMKADPFARADVKALQKMLDVGHGSGIQSR